MPTDPILEFAADFAPGDPQVLAEAKALLADPPKTLETIGFYGAENHPARARSYLGIVSLLENSENLIGVEDKYVPELLWNWHEQGLIRPAEFPPEAAQVFGPLFQSDFEPPPDAELPAFREAVWNSYAKAVEQIEDQLAQQGKALLSIDATEGDTMFFALVAPETAARWRDKALCEYDGYRAGVRAPMWDRYWVFLLYATGGLLGDYNRPGYPPGIRRRSDDIPFA